MKKLWIKRYVYVFISFLMFLLLGITYAWSIFVSPLENAYGWTRVQTSLAFTILMTGFSCGSLLTGIFAKKIGYRSISMVGAILIGGGFLATAFTSNIMILYVTYSVCVGLGNGMLYNSLVSVVPLWFPDKKGMITGLLLMGYAISTSVLSPVCQWLLTDYGPKNTFLSLGILNGVVFLIGSLVLKMPTEEEQALLPQESKKEEVGASADYTTGEMLHSGIFYIYFLGADIFVMVGLGYLNHVAMALQSELGISAVSTAYVVSAMSLCNGIARPLTGQFADRMGIRMTVRVLSLIYTVAGALTLFALIQRMPGLMIFAVCLMLFAYGGHGASLPCVIRKLYGNQYFSMNYSIGCLVSLTASVCPSLVGKMQTAGGSYVSGFALMLGFCIASIPLMFAVRNPQAKSSRQSR